MHVGDASNYNGAVDADGDSAVGIVPNHASDNTGTGTNPFAFMPDSDGIADLKVALERLDEKSRTVLIEYYGLEHTQAEIAAFYGISDRAISKRLDKAHALARKRNR